MKIYLLIALTLFGSLACHAQETAAPTPPVQQAGNVELRYNEANNFTIASLKPFLLSGTDPNKLEFDAIASFDGETPTQEPPYVGIGFRSVSRREWFNDNRELILTLDGERLPLGTMQRVRRACTKIPPSGYGCAQNDEKLDLRIPYQTFSRIIRAKIVSGEVGVRKFSLKDSDLEMMRAFDKLIAPQERQ